MLKLRVHQVDNSVVAGSPDDAARPTTSTRPAGGGTGNDQAGGGGTGEERGGALDALLGLASALTRLSAVDDIASEVARAALSVLQVSRAAVLVWEPGDGLLVRRGEADAGPPESTRPVAPASAPLPPTTVSSMVRRPTPTALRGRGSGILQAVASVAGMEDGTMVPLVASGELLGVLAVSAPDPGAAGAPGAPPPSDDEARTRAMGLAALAATGLGNAQLLSRIRHQAEHDPLTGLPTLRLVERLGVSGLADARRRGAPIVILFVDLDGFREVNEQLGHAAGDRVLVQVAGRLRAAVRGADIVGRVGGDEFVVVLTQVGHLAGGQAVAERVVRSLGDPFAIDGVTVSVGASVGVALTTPEDLSLAGPLARADAAMVRAKRAGRGRVGLDQGTVVGPVLG